MRFWNLHRWTLGLSHQCAPVNQSVQELETISVFQNRIQHCEHNISLKYTNFPDADLFQGTRTTHSDQALRLLSKYIRRSRQPVGSFSQLLDNRWSAGDENCLSDNVNCDGNLWYRGKVNTSEVIWHTGLYSSIMSLSCLYCLGHCNALDHVTSLACQARGNCCAPILSTDIMSMLQTGKYKFLATFPGIYKERPITHYHVKVSSIKGVNEISRNTIFGEGAYLRNYYELFMSLLSMG